MPSTSRGGRRRNAPAPHPEAVGPARGPSRMWVPRRPPPAAVAGSSPHPAPDAAAAVEPRPRGPVWVPRLPPAAAAVAVSARNPDNPAPRAAAPPNPSPLGPQARAPTPVPPPAVVARKPDDPAPRPAPPNPSPLEPHQARAPTPMPSPPSSSSSSSSSSRRRNRRRNRGKKGEAQEEETRDWAALPLDAITAILRKLDHVEILLGAGKVCRSWRHAARDDPSLWRRIDMLRHPDLERVVNLYGMAQEAIRRAKGQCEAFWAEYAADDDVLRLLGDEAPALKSLHLIACQDIVEFEEEIKKFPLLEELEISLSTNIGGKHVFEEVGKACPELKHFRFNKYRFYDLRDTHYSESEDDGSEFKYNKDDNALGIANMHGLRSLQLFGNKFTNKGLTAILENCPHLEFLDIRHCFNIQMDNALRAKCAAIKTLKLPHDSTDDYNLRFEGPILSRADLGIDFDTDSDGYGYDYILDSDEYDDYCDPMRYLDGVYESELGPEDRMFLKSMHMLMRDDDDDDY